MAVVQQTLIGFQGQEEIEGVVDSVIYASDDGKFSVFRVKPSQQNSRITATIKGEPPLVGQQVHLKGQWVNHALGCGERPIEAPCVECASWHRASSTVSARPWPIAS